MLDGIERGLIGPGKKKHLLDATSGNTGIAYAMLGAAMGFPVTLVMPSNVSPERKQILAAYGVKIVWTDAADGTDGAIRKAREMASSHPDDIGTPTNIQTTTTARALSTPTANEIWHQTEGRVTHFVAGLGTSGTFVGTTRRLKELNPQIQCISLEPDSPFNGLEGLKHMETAMVPEFMTRILPTGKWRWDGSGVRDGETTRAGERPDGWYLRRGCRSCFKASCKGVCGERRKR